MRYLLIRDGVITNVIEYDPSHSYQPPEGHQLIPHDHDAPHDIGWTWDGERATDLRPKKSSPHVQPLHGKVL